MPVAPSYKAEPLRIALVTDFYLPSLGGAQTSVLNQKKALEQAGHTVYIFTTQYNTAEPTDTDRVIRLPAFYINSLEFPLVLFSKKLQSHLQKIFVQLDIQLIHTQTEFGLAHTAAQAAQHLGIPVVHTVHTFSWKSNYTLPTLTGTLAQLFGVLVFRKKMRWLAPQPDENKLIATLKSFTLAMAQQGNYVVCPSQHTAQALRQAGATKPMHVIPNPMALATGRNTQPLPKIPRIVWSGRCRPEKRFLEFMQACLLAQKLTSKPFYVDIVGDGPLLAQAKAMTLGNKHIVFHGRVDVATSVSLINGSSVVAVSSYDFDNQPMIIAEAISAGRGVLYCDPKLKEGLTGDTSYLTQPEPASMAAGIAHLVEHPQAIRAMSIAASKKATLFSAQTFAKKITKLYKQALSHQP